MKRARGFTLLELLITIAVAAIVLGIGIPSFQQMIASNRLATQSNTFVTGLSLARSEAMKRSLAITMCRSLDGNSCTTSGSSWTTGWIVIDAGGDVIARQGGLRGDNTLTGNHHVRHAVTFTPQGMLQPHVLGGTFTLCDARRAGHQRSIAVAKTGRVSMTRFDGNGTAC